jgi:hypothetical protein
LYGQPENKNKSTLLFLNKEELERYFREYQQNGVPNY